MDTNKLLKKYCDMHFENCTHFANKFANDIFGKTSSIKEDISDIKAYKYFKTISKFVNSSDKPINGWFASIRMLDRRQPHHIGVSVDGYIFHCFDGCVYKHLPVDLHKYGMCVVRYYEGKDAKN